MSRGGYGCRAKAQGPALNPYNVALKDWFHKPEIQVLDVSGWDGGAGRPVCIQAIDDVQKGDCRIIEEVCIMKLSSA